MRIAFAGTAEFAAHALRALIEAGHDVVLVLTQPDRPAGRGLKVQPSAVKTLAMQHGLPLIQARGLRLDGSCADDAGAARRALAIAAPTCMVVAAYGLILPAWVLALPPLGCLNIHASLLPRWRGAAPIHRAIEAGDLETGITLMQMDAGLDTGDMLMVERLAIAPSDTTGTLHDRLALMGGRVVVRALAADGLARTAQPTEGIVYARKVDKAEAAIDWSQPAAVIERRTRAFDPFPGATFSFAGEPIKLWRARVVSGSDDIGGDVADMLGGSVSGGSSAAIPGLVMVAQSGRLHVACGSGTLELQSLQCPGGRRIGAAGFLQARALKAGTVLG